MIEALRACIETLSGLPVIYAESAGPRTQRPHLRVLRLSTRQLGQPYRHVSGEVIQRRRAVVQVDAIGVEAVEEMDGIVTGLWVDQPALRILWGAEATVVDVGDVLSTSEILQTGYEPRSTVQVTIAYLERQLPAYGSPPATAIEATLTDDDDHEATVREEL